MIKILVVAVLLICGLIVLVLPKDKLVNKDKMKPDKDPEQIVKQSRTMGIVFIVLAIVFFFIM